MKYFIKALQNYATFNGRARRSEYWYFVLFNFIFLIIYVILSDFLFASVTIAGKFGLEEILIWIYLLIMLIPSIAVGVRRMHDSGKSGWFILIPIYSLILTFIAGTKGNNKYGDDPKTII